MPPKTRKRGRALQQETTPVKTQKKEQTVDVKTQETKHEEAIRTAVASAWGMSNDRYMRRKKREYLHEKLAAQAALKTVQKEHETKEQTTEQKQEAGQEQEQEQETEQDEDEVWDEERDKQDAAEQNMTPEAMFPERKEESEVVVEEAVVAEEEVEVEAEDKNAVPEPLSPARASVHSPLETISQQHQSSAIEPTPEKSAPLLGIASKPKKSVARGIAQSSSSASTRKRMISFSPERAPRPENRALALKKLEKNLKTNEKLQQRLKAPTPVKAPTPSRMSSPATATQTRRPITFTSPQARRPVTFSSPQARRPTTFTSPSPRRPIFHQSPYTASCSLPLSQTEELDYDEIQKGQHEEKDVSLAEVAHLDFKPCVAVEEEAAVEGDGEVVHCAEEDGGVIMHSQDEVCLSQEFVASHDGELAPLSQESMTSLAEGDTPAAHTESSTSAFTSTSVIGDVGLFNCEADVEYTGGVYGEGTDGKVTAAVINGQKVALKRAKPHEGFPEHEAKRRAALELHYLRRVRHMKGFLQCLGLCDAIEHTCIALEVMDCKLSDYLRRYGVNSGGSKRRRYTLSFDDTKAMLKQICLPMITLHEAVNVAHGDLACRNILMRTPPEGYEQSWEPDIKLSDFGRIKLPADEPKILDSSFSFHKNCDVGAFGREILYRLLVGEIVPKEYVETRSLHKLLQDVTVTQVPDAAKDRLGPYYNLFMRCTGWGVRPTFREVYEHLDNLEYFETTENGLFPLKPIGSTDASFMSPVAEGSRHKTPTSSASRAHKRDTPTGHRPAGPKSRLFATKSFTEAPAQGPNKPVNWLKTRSVGVQRTVVQQVLTPTAARPLLIKKKRKTPPSAGAGASRRSLQILNQIQHRTTEKGRKST
ncbi:hypothetical protein PRNP1_010875 [Phytophthora ramorum]